MVLNHTATCEVGQSVALQIVHDTVLVEIALEFWFSCLQKL